MGVTDCHVHINPAWEMTPDARALIETSGTGAEELLRMLREPPRFLEYLDHCGVERAVLVNYVSPRVVGYTVRANEFVTQYVRGHEDRLIAVGSPDMELREDPRRTLEDLASRGLRGIKLHPAHQQVRPNAYRPEEGGWGALRTFYEACEDLRLPLIVHTGTSIFPGARSKFADPLLLEDVAVDFPRLTLVLAHGGRPFWTESAMFLARRFPHVYLEVSGVPPRRLLEYFPRLERLASKTLFGTDWPGPGVRDIRQNLEDFRSCGLSPSAVRAILEDNPLRVFPPP
jgi:predicted TIM-barrel fold metal-dependent hydrolase